MKDFSAYLKRLCDRNGFPFDRLQVRTFDQLGLSYISRGVVFVHAPWSGQSLASFDVLCRALTVANPEDCLLIILNIDELPQEAFTSTFAMACGGYGAAFWIRHGMTLYADDGYQRGNIDDLAQSRIEKFAAFLSDTREGDKK
jgi:hypothetical protein